MGQTLLFLSVLMKAPVRNRFVIVCLVMALPMMGWAAGGARTLGISHAFSELTLLDSTNRRPVQKPEDKKPEVDKPDVIKEVPRSRRLPKPTAVIDRVRIKRPPVMRPGVIRKRLGFR